MDVLFVNMPFMHIKFPSLALGILHALLKEAGVSSRVVYANLLFAECLSIKVSLKAEKHWNTNHLGDWLFQRALFPENPLNEKDFVETYFKVQTGNQNKFAGRCYTLAGLREKSEKFLAELVEDISDRKPVAVGCTATTVQLLPALAFLKCLKQSAPNVVTMIGGPACESAMGEAIHESFPFLDYTVSGDADGLIVDFAEGILRKGPFLGTEDLPEGVLGLDHRMEKKIVGEPVLKSPPPRATTFSLKGLPPPDYDDYFETLQSSETIRKRIVPSLSFETSRGCWWGEKSLCHFCGDCGTTPAYRTKPPEQVIHELRYLANRYGIRRFVATDNIFNTAFFDSFLPQLRQNHDDFTLFFETRATLNREQLKNLRLAGVTYLQAGIESLHTRALKELNKGTRSWENIRCLKWCRQFGIHLSWFILTRFPDEEDSWNRIQADFIPLLTHLEPPRFISIIRPDRFSPYFENAEQYGLSIHVEKNYLKFLPPEMDRLEDFVFHLQEKGVQKQVKDPWDRFLRPGTYALKKAVKRWKKAFSQVGEPPTLQIVEEGGEVISIQDTRKIATDRIHRLQKREGDVLMACREGARMEYLYKEFSERGIKRMETDRIMEGLKDRHLIVQLDSVALSLVLEPRIHPYLPFEKEAVGWIRKET